MTAKYGTEWKRKRRQDPAYREKELEQIRKWREKNPEKVKRTRDSYYENNKDKVVEKNARWYENNREKMLEAKRLWYCANKQRLSAVGKQRRSEDPIRLALKGARARARKDGVEFSILAEHVPMPETCPLLNIPLVVGNGRACDGSPTIDRLDNSLGYVPGNVWVISFLANSMKRNASIDQLKEFSRNVLKLL